MKKAIFLDRDGTLNIFERGAYITKPEQIKLLDGAAALVKAINEQGYLAIIISNQGGVMAHHGLSITDVEAINQRLIDLLAAEGAQIDAAKFCPHYPSVDGVCDCRKPKPGLINECVTQFEINRLDSYMVGDFDSDVQAGKAAGVKTIKIGKKTQATSDFLAADLSEVKDYIRKL